MKSKLLLVLSFFILACSRQTSLPEAKNGLLDLSTLSVETFEHLESLEVNGEWEFYYKTLPNQEGILDISEKKATLAQVPYFWNDLIPNEESPFGYGTYRLRVLLPAPRMTLYFRLQPQTSNYHFYINGNLLSQAGQVGISPDSEVPEYKVLFTQFEAPTQEIELLMAISNHNHARGGFRKPIFMGTKKQVQDSAFLHSIEEIFIFGSLVSMSLYQFTVFIIRRTQWSSLHFAFFCLITLLRLLILENHYIKYIIPDFPYDWMLRFDYASTFFMVSFFLSFLKTIFPLPGDIMKVLVKASWYISFGNLFYVLVSPINQFTSTNFINEILLIGFIFLIFFVLLRIVFLKRRDSKLVFVSTFLILAAGLHDVLAGNSHIQAPQILPFALFLFFVLQSILLSKRNAGIYLSMEKLTGEVEDLYSKLATTNKAYSRFVPFRFLSSFGKQNILDVSLGDFTHKKIVILSSDIRDFSTISESLSAEQNFLFINKYLSKVGPVIRNNGGYIEKYIGDAVIAFFDQKPEDAIAAAIQMQEAIQIWNSEVDPVKDFHMSIGVGIHYSDVMLAVIGDDVRNQSSVLSDGFMIANQLEALTKKYGAKILVSLDALLETKNPDAHPHRLVDFVHVTSKKKPLGVVEILVGGDFLAEKIEHIREFEEAVNVFWDGHFEESAKLWKALVQKLPHDKATLLYAERSESFAKDGPPPGWTGF